MTDQKSQQRFNKNNKERTQSVETAAPGDLAGLESVICNNLFNDSLKQEAVMGTSLRLRLTAGETNPVRKERNDGSPREKLGLPLKTDSQAERVEVAGEEKKGGCEFCSSQGCGQ